MKRLLRRLTRVTFPKQLVVAPVAVADGELFVGYKRLEDVDLPDRTTVALYELREVRTLRVLRRLVE